MWWCSFPFHSCILFHSVAKPPLFCSQSPRGDVWRWIVSEFCPPVIHKIMCILDRHLSGLEIFIVKNQMPFAKTVKPGYSPTDDVWEPVSPHPHPYLILSMSFLLANVIGENDLIPFFFFFKVISLSRLPLFIIIHHCFSRRSGSIECWHCLLLISWL